MQRSQRLRMTEAEYLAFENASIEKHYYVNGEVFPVHPDPETGMAGGTFAHARVAGNAIRLLGNALHGGPCGVQTSDQRVHVDDTGLYVYPDITVVCDKPRRTPSPSRALLNPTAIVEVLSPGTEDDDRGWKWQHYQRISSLRTYILVNPLARHVEVYTREGDAWIYQATDESQGTVTIAAFSIELPLADLFAGLDGLDEDGDAPIVE
jgi:Uma2 family endonuclease